MFSAPSWTRSRGRATDPRSSAETDNDHGIRAGMAMDAPPRGSDSNYGVVSIEWDMEPASRVSPRAESPMHEDELGSGVEQQAESPVQEDEPASPQGAAPEDTPIQQTLPLLDDEDADDDADADDQPRLSASHLRRLSASPPPSSRHTESVTDFELDLESATDASSAPPSPTSLTSMPSYVPSVSDISRASSPGAPPHRSPSAVVAALARDREDARVAALALGNAALVIPELSLPSSSLHLSLRTWEGPGAGVKIVLLGPQDLTRRVMRCLGEREELVELQGRKGHVGVLRGDKIVGVVVTGLTPDEIRIRTLKGYSTLHGLLNPSAGRHEEGQQLADLVGAFSERDDWVHAVLGVDKDSRTQAESLQILVPVLTCESPLAPSPIIESPLDEPTPLARIESTSYFTSQSDTDAVPLVDAHGIAQTIIRALGDKHTRSASAGRFLAWRPPSLDSSDSSLDSQNTPPSASGLDGPPMLMPTVARAKGAAEWDATLSRRVAHQRDEAAIPLASGSASIGAGGDAGEGKTRGSGTKSRRSSAGETRRRRSKKEAEAPLFPPRPRVSPRGSECGEVGLGLGLGLGWTKLFRQTFEAWGVRVGAVRDGVEGLAFGSSRWNGWRGWVVAAVVVGVVGLGVYFGGQ